MDKAKSEMLESHKIELIDLRAFKIEAIASITTF
jgi:hypothetical protein